MKNGFSYGYASIDLARDYAVKASRHVKNVNVTVADIRAMGACSEGMTRFRKKYGFEKHSFAAYKKIAEAVSWGVACSMDALERSNVRNDMLAYVIPAKIRKVKTTVLRTNRVWKFVFKIAESEIVPAPVTIALDFFANGEARETAEKQGFVYKTLAVTPANDYHKQWYVTHVPTGRTIGNSFSNKNLGIFAMLFYAEQVPELLDETRKVFKGNKELSARAYKTQRTIESFFANYGGN